MSGTVYIVHCVDTEGPLYQRADTPFEMLRSIYGIDVNPSAENLDMISRGEMDFGDNTEAIRQLFDMQRNRTLGTWDEISRMIERVTAEPFRHTLKDSAGNGWKYSWFCMDHVGFTGHNPRRRIAGHHSIFDFYSELVSTQKQGDIVQFHHHPLPFSGNYNDCATAFWGRSTLNDILTRKIVDRMWFPSAYRPGFHTERPDSHWFLEQWFPFDYANQAIDGDIVNQPDLSNGRFGDWRRAPKEWIVYHPSHDDYQRIGDCRRWIARCLNMYARLRQIEIGDIREAFARAANNGNTLLSYTNHDFRDMEFEIIRIRDMIEMVSREFPNVRFEYADAVNGMRKTLGLGHNAVELETRLDVQGNVLYVSSGGHIFGPQPFLAIKTLSGEYHWDNFDFQGDNRWSYVFDNQSIELDCIEKIGVAANSDCGTTEVTVIDARTALQKKLVWDYPG